MLICKLKDINYINGFFKVLDHLNNYATMIAYLAMYSSPGWQKSQRLTPEYDIQGVSSLRSLPP